MSSSLQQAVLKDAEQYFTEDPNHYNDFVHDIKNIMNTFSNDDLSKGISGLSERERRIFHCSLMVHTDYKDAVNENTLSSIPRDDLAMVFLKMPPSIFDTFVSGILQ